MGQSDIELQQDIVTLEIALNMAVALWSVRSVDMLDTDQSNAAVSAYKRELLKPKISPKE